jgi:hypothetical protein
MKREGAVWADTALIICVVRRGMAGQLVEAAREAGARGATVGDVRRCKGSTDLHTRAAPDDEIVSVMVRVDQIARVLLRVYMTGEMQAGMRGPISVIPLGKAARNRASGKGSAAGKAS